MEKIDFLFNLKGPISVQDPFSHLSTRTPTMPPKGPILAYISSDNSTSDEYRDLLNGRNKPKQTINSTKSTVIENNNRIQNFSNIHVQHSSNDHFLALLTQNNFKRSSDPRSDTGLSYRMGTYLN